MSSKVIVILEDDVDGGKAERPLSSAIDGASYEIDLSDSERQEAP